MTRLNYCRVYLKVELLSDITTSNGQRLIPNIYQQKEGKQLDNQLYKENWPIQATPDANTWNFWNKTIIHLCTDGSGRLKTKLGPWKRITKPWKVYYDKRNNAI